MSNRKHSIRMLGIAFVAVVAMSAVAASASSAAFFHEGEGKARVIAKNENHEGKVSIHKFTAGLIGTFECKKATFTGTEFVTSPQKSVTVTAAYSECTFLGVANVVVNMNGCTYRFNEPTGLGPYTGTVTVLCPAGKKITISAEGCIVEVGSQGPLGTLTYTNWKELVPPAVEVSANVTGITYTGSPLCPNEPGTHSNGTYKGIALARAEEGFGVIVGAWIE